MTEILTAIPVYNGESYLAATLESLAAQTRRPDRVVVIDDCSTDGTRDLVREFKGLPCELVENPKNVGLFPNLNLALGYAEEADFFHLLLADDCVRPEFLERLTGCLEGEKPFSLAYCGIDWINAEGQVIRSVGQNRAGRVQSVSRRAFLSRQSFLKTVSVGSVLIRTGGYALPVRFRRDMPHVADCVFYAELAAACQAILAVPESLCEIRRHDANATRENTQNLNAWVTDEFRAMQRIADMIPEPYWRNRLRDHQQQILFAARSRVKQQWTMRQDPRFSEQIGAVVRREMSIFHQAIGYGSVLVRDLLFGKNRPENPR